MKPENGQTRYVWRSGEGECAFKWQDTSTPVDWVRDNLQVPAWVDPKDHWAMLTAMNQPRVFGALKVGQKFEVKDISIRPFVKIEIEGMGSAYALYEEIESMSGLQPLQPLPVAEEDDCSK